MNKTKLISILFILTLLLINVVRVWPFTVDDAFITFRYSRHLGEGYGIRWNKTGNPVEGFTNFLLVVILGSLHFIGVDVVLAGKIIGVIATIGLALILFSFILRTNNSIVSALVCTLLFVLPETVALHAVSGLETMLFSFFFTTLIILVYRYVSASSLEHEVMPKTQTQLLGVFNFLSLVKRSVREYLDEILISIDVLILAMIRPEGVLIFVIILISVGIWRYDRLLRLLKTSLLIVGVLGGAYFMWRWSYFGYLLPNTFYLKSATQRRLVNLSSAEYIWNYLRFIGAPSWLILVIYWFRNSINKEERILLANFVFFCAYYMTVFTNTMGYAHRFLIPTFPVFLLMLSFAVDYLMKSIMNSRLINLLNTTWRLSLLLSILSLSLIILLSFSSFSEKVTFFYTKYSDGLENAHIRIGKLLGNLFHEGRLVVMSDAGAIPFYSNWETIDGGGLSDPYLTHQGFDIDYFFEFHPDAFVFTSKSITQLTTPESIAITSDPRFQNYMLAGEFYFNRNYWEHLYVRDTSPIYSQLMLEAGKVINNMYPYTNIPDSSHSVNFAIDHTNDSIMLRFPIPDPGMGDLIGAFATLNFEPGICYKISIDVLDPYSIDKFPGRINQVIYVDDRMMWSHDISGDLINGWQTIQFLYLPDLDTAGIRVENEVIGQLESGWQWGYVAKLGVRNLNTELVETCDT